VIGEGVSVSVRDDGETGTVVGFAVTRCTVAAGRIEGVAKASVGNRVAIDPTS
jgi:hypothetical protein